MTTALIFAWTTTALSQSPAPPDDASIAMHANLSVIKDLEFVHGGRVGLANAEDKPELRANAAPDDDYQGTYAYRTGDAASLLDIYHHPRRADAPLRRETQAILASKLQILNQTPDLSRKQSPIAYRDGGPGSFNTTASPEPFVPFWIFREILLDPMSYHYELLGREEVDGRDCRKIQVNEFYRYDLPERRIVVYWLDLERGGLPLKIEYQRKGVVTRRTHKIQLQSFKTDDGQTAWIPVGGETDYFSSEEGEVAGQPCTRDICAIVPTSVRINQGLRDDDFSVRRDAARPPSEVIKKARDQLEVETANKRKARPRRTDPNGVREKLAENLAEADRQAKEIEASSVAREASRWPSASAIMVAVALAVASFVIYLAWRRR